MITLLNTSELTWRIYEEHYCRVDSPQESPLCPHPQDIYTTDDILPHKHQGDYRSFLRIILPTKFPQGGYQQIATEKMKEIAHCTSPLNRVTRGTDATDGWMQSEMTPATGTWSGMGRNAAVFFAREGLRLRWRTLVRKAATLPLPLEAGGNALFNSLWYCQTGGHRSSG